MLNINKKHLCLSIFIFAIGFLGSTQLLAQKKSKKKEKEPKVNIWKERMWYGGGVSLGLQSATLGNSVNGNIFQIGISPLVGYKINSFWSVGPRVEVVYTGGRFSDPPDIWKYNAVEYGFGVFSRLKFLRVLFAHFEYSVYNEIDQNESLILKNNRLISQRKTSDRLLAGLGYNGGNEIDYEFYLMYNFLADKESVQLPIQYRIGFTYLF